MVVINILLELRKVVVEGKMNHTVCPRRSFAQAIEILDVAVKHLSPSPSQLLRARL